MIKLDKTRYSLAGSYPKNPVLRESRRSWAKPGTSYARVDLAMREPLRILNEELGIRTVSSCEYHPCYLDKRLYQACQNRWPERYCMDRLPYRSFIVLDLEKYYRIVSLRDYLARLGFVTDGETSYHGGFDSMDMDDEEATINLYKGFKTEFTSGILGIRYASNAAGIPINCQCSIDVIPSERQNIHQWKEWDHIRDTGWEYWLEILYLFTKEGA